jgi:hypothetical protein
MDSAYAVSMIGSCCTSCPRWNASAARNDQTCARSAAGRGARSRCSR